MIRSRNWPAIERLPESPGVAVMTSGGYWLDGRFYPTHRARPSDIGNPITAQPRRSLFARIWK